MPTKPRRRLGGHCSGLWVWFGIGAAIPSPCTRSEDRPSLPKRRQPTWTPELFGAVRRLREQHPS